MTGKKLKVKISCILLIITTLIFLTEGTALAIGSASSKEPEFRLDIDSLNLQKWVSANLVFSIVNAKNVKEISIQGLENFDVLSTSKSTSTRIINGNTTYQKDISYSIMPKSTGQFTLKGTVKYNGSIYVTNELQINVSEEQTVSQGEAKDIFIKTIASDDEIYFGQKVILGYELFSRYNIENFGFLDEVNIDNFIISDVPQDKLNANYIYIDNNKYVKYEAKKMYLSPIKTGTVKIPLYNFQVNVSTGDFFDSSKPFYLQTEPKEITVKPLPLENQPSDFSGIVGDLKLEANYSKNEINYGDSIILKVTASGNCNLDNLNKIIKDEISGFSVYETEKDLEQKIVNNQYQAKKEFEIILVPEKNGDIKINPIYISYFDTKSGSYKKAEVHGTNIKVNGEVPKVQKQEPQEQNEIKTLENVKIDQVSYNIPNDEYVTIQIKKNSLIISLVVFVIVLIFIILVYLLLRHRKKQDKKLQDIYKQIKNTENQNQIYNLFNSMIKHCFNISLKASSRSQIINSIEEHEIVDLVLEIMDYMENQKDNTNRSNKYLKDKIKGIYKKLN